jgi:hypothetical protein
MTPEVTLSATSPSARFISGQAGQSVSLSYISRYADQISTAKRIKEFLDYILRFIDTPSHSDVGLAGILGEIESFRVAENDEEGYIFRSTPRASVHAADYIITAYRAMLDGFPRPKIEPDGEGGLVFDWRNNGKIIRLACRAKPNQRDYIYYQFRDTHEAKAASHSLLFDCLNWLMHNE